MTCNITTVINNKVTMTYNITVVFSISTTSCSITILHCIAIATCNRNYVQHSNNEIQHKIIYSISTQTYNVTVINSIAIKTVQNLQRDTASQQSHPTQTAMTYSITIIAQQQQLNTMYLKVVIQGQ